MTDKMIKTRAKARAVSTDEYMKGNLLLNEVKAEDVAKAFLHLATSNKTTGAVVPPIYQTATYVLEEVGKEDVFRKIKNDFQAASINIEEVEIRNQMEKALSRAKEDFKK